MEQGFEEAVQDHLKQYIEDAVTIQAFSWDIVNQLSVDSKTFIVDMNVMSKVERSRFLVKSRHRHYEIHQYVATGIDLAVLVAFDWFTNTLYINVKGTEGVTHENAT